MLCIVDPLTMRVCYRSMQKQPGYNSGIQQVAVVAIIIGERRQCNGALASFGRMHYAHDRLLITQMSEKEEQKKVDDKKKGGS